jgi:hypothetical protein
MKHLKIELASWGILRMLSDRGNNAYGGNLKKQRKDLPTMNSNGNQLICPYHNKKTELCTAALASSMVYELRCSSGRYKQCTIYLINKRKEEKASKCADPDEG